MFGVAGVLLLLTSAYVEGLDAQISGYVGQRVELYCRREAKFQFVSEIFWLKNGEIWIKFDFKEDYDVILNKSHATLVIPSVKENDTGLYQCGKSSQLTNLTVLKISKNTSTGSSDNHVDLLQNILNSIFVNRLFLITLLLGVGIIVTFYIWKWWEGKSKHQTNAGYLECEDPLTDDFKMLVRDVKEVQCQQQKGYEDIIDKIVKLKEDIGSKDEALNDRLAEILRAITESYTKQSEDLVTLCENVASNIDKLGEKVSAHHSTVVHELKQQSNITKRQDKALKDIKEILQQIWASDKRGISVIDADLDNDG